MDRWLAHHLAELISEASLAIEMVASRDDVVGVIHPHPTLAEAVHAAFEAAR